MPAWYPVTPLYPVVPVVCHNTVGSSAVDREDVRDRMHLAMLDHLELQGATYYAGDYAGCDTRGRHDVTRIADTAESDGAACKLTDELYDRGAFAKITAGDLWAISAPGRHRHE